MNDLRASIREGTPTQSRKYLLRPRVLERLFGVLQEAHDRACTEIRCGVEVGDIFRVAQGHITKNGIERLHRLPHGLKTFS